MRILFFIHDSSLYGASQSLFTLLKALKRKESFSILVLLPYGGPLEGLLRDENIRYEIIPFPRCIAIGLIKNKFDRFKEIWKYNKKVRSVKGSLQEIFNSFQPDLVYTNTSVISVGFQCAKRHKLPHVWHVREFGNLDYSFNYLPSYDKVRNMVNKSSHTIFVSESLRKHWAFKSNQNTSVIYNGIYDTDDENYYHRVERNKTRLKTIGILGAIIEGKGQHIAIEAIAKLKKRNPEMVLFIYGNVIDNTYYQYLEGIIKKFAIEEKVVFKGFVNSKKEIYNNLDILLCCSRKEGFGRTMVEAMLFGVPVIANASGGALEIIQPNVNGLLYHSTSEELAEQIMLLENPTVYTSIVRHAYQEAKVKYSVSKYVNEVREVFLKSS